MTEDEAAQAIAEALSDLDEKRLAALAAEAQRLLAEQVDES